MSEEPSNHRLGQSAFVGRERELRELQAGLDEVRSGRGRFFLVTGEPGIGKSRLADEVAEHAASRAMLVLRAGCSEGGRYSRLLVVHSIASRRLGQRGTRGPAQAVGGGVRAGSVGLRGQDRKSSSHADRARLAVTKSIKSALNLIRATDAELGRHLALSIKTGHLCAYFPVSPVKWHL
jgi:predicted ATPase